MLRPIAILKVSAICLGVVFIAGCSKKDKPELAVQGQEQAIPGSERDFIVNVGDRIQFLVDQSTLTAQAQDTLQRQAAWMKQYSQVSVQVEGHADERGTREYNIALSARRATTTRQYLIAQGIDPARISKIAYGKERPVALCDAESCWSQNRRAVTIVTGGAVSG